MLKKTISFLLLFTIGQQAWGANSNLETIKKNSEYVAKVMAGWKSSPTFSQICRQNFVGIGLSKCLSYGNPGSLGNPIIFDSLVDAINTPLSADKIVKSNITFEKATFSGKTGIIVIRLYGETKPVNSNGTKLVNTNKSKFTFNYVKMGSELKINDLVVHYSLTDTKKV